MPRENINGEENQEDSAFYSMKSLDRVESCGRPENQLLNATDGDSRLENQSMDNYKHVVAFPQAR